MPNGVIQQEFTDTLNVIGKWLQQYGNSIYGTRGNIINPQDWGIMTGRDKTRFVHLLNRPAGDYIFVSGYKETVTEAVAYDNKQKLRFKQIPEGLFIYLQGLPFHAIDAIVELKVR